MPLAPILNQQSRWTKAVESIVKLYFTVKSYSTSFIAHSYYGSAKAVKSLATGFTLQGYYGKVRMLKQNIREFILKLKQ